MDSSQLPADEQQPAEALVGSRSTRPLTSRLRLVSLCTFASRVLGMIRDMAMAACFGSTVILDAFTVAFRIPNLARRVFGEGALTTAFLPIFVRATQQQGESQAWRLAATVLAVLAAVLLAVVVAGEALLWGLSHWVSAGADGRLLIGLVAVMLPYLMLICLSAQLGALLNAREHFLWPALSSVLLNVLWLAAIAAVAVWMEDPRQQIYWIAATITLAGLVQIAAQIPTLRQMGFRFVLDFGLAGNALREITQTLLPVVIGLSITQLNTLVDGVLAWSLSHAGPRWEAWGLALPEGTAAALYFGQRMYQFPLGVFGIALGTVIYPRFSLHAARRDRLGMKSDFEFAVRLVLLIGIPASAGLVLLAQPLATALFQYGEFTSQHSQMTAGMIAAYAAGVWAYCGILIINRLYYAVGDQRTPLRSGVVVLVLNIPLSFALVPLLGAAGLAVSTVICAVVQLLLIVRGVGSHMDSFAWSSVWGFVARVLQATAGMLLVAAACLAAIPADEAVLIRVLRVGLPLCTALAAYVGLCRLLKIRELDTLLRRDSRSN